MIDDPKCKDWQTNSHLETLLVSFVYWSYLSLALAILSLKWTGHHRGEIKLSFWRDIWKLTDSISFREEILFFICFTPGNHWAISERIIIDSDEMLRNYTSSTAHNMWINTRLNCIFIVPWYFQSHWRIWQRKRKQVVNKFSIDHFFC